MIRPAALALTGLALVACGDTPTETETAGGAPAGPALALASNTWVTRANLPGSVRAWLATAVARNAARQSVLYAIGGRVISTGGSLGTVQAYNVATNTWTYRASLPMAVYNSNGAGVIGGKIYISGGETKDKYFRRELYMYDPASNTWTRKRDMPDDTWGGITAVFGNKLYVLTCSESEEDCYLDVEPLELYRYDPATDGWTFLTYSPPLRGRPMGGFVGGKFYVMAGTGLYEDVGPTFYAYDPATNEWTQKRPLAKPRWLGAGVALGGKLYILGGVQHETDGSLRPVRSVNVYDPVTDTWTTKAPMPTQRNGVGASLVVVDGQQRIEVVGGVRPGNNVQYVP